MNACSICGRPESEGRLRWLNGYDEYECVGPCEKFHGPVQRIYGELTPNKLDYLERRADLDSLVSVSPETLHSLLLCARYCVKFGVNL